MFILIGKEFLQTHICGINIRSEPSVPQVAKKKSLHNQSLFGKDGGVVLTSFTEQLKRRTIFSIFQTFSAGDAGYKLLSLQL